MVFLFTGFLLYLFSLLLVFPFTGSPLCWFSPLMVFPCNGFSLYWFSLYWLSLLFVFSFTDFSLYWFSLLLVVLVLPCILLSLEWAWSLCPFSTITIIKERMYAYKSLAVPYRIFFTYFFGGIIHNVYMLNKKHWVQRLIILHIVIYIAYNAWLFCFIVSLCTTCKFKKIHAYNVRLLADPGEARGCFTNIVVSH